MARILITGGSGGLGQELVPRLRREGHTLRILSRSATSRQADVEWTQGFLGTGEGLDQAVAGMDIIIHAASSGFKDTENVDVQGTVRLLAAAEKANVKHFIYTSIVGVDILPLPYFQHKFAAEKVVEKANIPWSILRATQFHTLVDTAFKGMLRFPIGMVLKGWRFQPIETGDVANRLVEIANGEAGGHLPDIAGPEIFTMLELAREWARVQGKKRWIIQLPMPGKISVGYQQGLNTAPQKRYGTITWAQWLEKTYGSAQQKIDGVARHSAT